MMYKYLITRTETLIIHLPTGTILPEHSQNPEFLDWKAQGNFPEAADPPHQLDYRALRAAAYPPVGDQLDAMWEGGQAHAAMLAQIRAVKDLYPKPPNGNQSQGVPK